MSCVTGDDTGLIKVWDISKSSGAKMKFTFGEQDRKRSIMSMCWLDSSTSSIVVSYKDGSVSLLNIEKKKLICSKDVGFFAELSSSLSFMKEKLFLVDGKGSISMFDSDLNELGKIDGCGTVNASHMNRKYGMIALGGKDSNLTVFDINGGDASNCVFRAENRRDHVLDVPYPVYLTGVCVMNPFVFCACTAYHEVFFYDRRASNRAIQEFEISREIEKRPTKLLQWNCNKFLIGEASGDVHLYDTRRGFSSRAKLRGGTGSVRSMAKHPSGHQILGVTGLDRKARLYHVPTGKLLMTLYTKQKCNCLLLDKNMPLTDDISSFSGVLNSKKSSSNSVVSSKIWDDMDPVVDEFEETPCSQEVRKKRMREIDED